MEVHMYILPLPSKNYMEAAEAVDLKCLTTLDILVETLAEEKEETTTKHLLGRMELMA